MQSGASQGFKGDAGVSGRLEGGSDRLEVNEKAQGLGGGRGLRRAGGGGASEGPEESRSSCD